MNALNGLGHIHRLRAGTRRPPTTTSGRLQIAQATGDRGGELNALNGLGHVHWLQGRYAQATDHSGGRCRSPEPPATAPASCTR